MHINKLKYFQKLYPEDRCLSGITTSTVGGFSVGTPCIAVVNPFIARETPSSSMFGRVRAITSPRFVIKDETPPEDEVDNGNTKAIDLYNMDVDKANAILKYSVKKLQVIFMHSIGSDGLDFQNHTIYNSSFYFNGIKPLIHDTCLRTESDRLEDILDNDGMKSVPNTMMGMLKDYRYVNYTINNLSRSYAHSLIDRIYTMIDSFGRELEFKTCFYHNVGNCRSIIDTMSISFYRLSDAIPIFDSSMAIGVCVDIALLSSAEDRVDHPEKSMCLKLLFCKYADNVFTIDGEEVNRPSDIPVGDALEYMARGLVKHVVGDRKSEKQKTESVNI